MCNAKKPEMHSIKSGGAGGSRLAWYAVMVLSCGVAFISYLDRAIMGVTILPMAAEEGYSKSVEGFISRYADRLSESHAYAVQSTGPCG